MAKLKATYSAIKAGAWHHQRHCRKNQQSHFINL
jgi:hypothetical protein